MKETHMTPTTTSHDATSWNVHRATLAELSHEVDQVRYVGVRGQRLEKMLTASYTEEARNLAADLCDLLKALPADIAGPLLEDFKGPLDHAARGRHDLRAVVNGDGAPVDVTGVDEIGSHRLDFLALEREPGVGDLATVDDDQIGAVFDIDGDEPDERADDG